MTPTKLSPLPADVLADMRKMAGARTPTSEKLRFDIDLVKTDDGQRPLLPQESIEMLGINMAFKASFIPQMMTALAMQKTIDLVNFCAEHRMSEFKKHTRALKRCIEVYTRNLLDYYGRKYYVAYTNYTQRYMQAVTTDVMLMMLNLQETASNKLQGVKHNEIAAMVAFIVLAIRYCDEYDRHIDRLVADKIKSPVHKTPDASIHIILNLCIGIADMGYKIPIESNARQWIKILSNRAYALADEIIAEDPKKHSINS